MKLHGLKKLTGFVVASLCLAWSGFSSAGDGAINYTTVSKASTKIQYYEQTATGVVDKVTIKTNDLILELTDSSADKPPKNQQLVLLNWCGDVDNFSALAVWDKDTDALAAGANATCLWSEGSWVYDEKKDRVYRPMDIEAADFNMDEIDMDAQISLGKVKKKVDPIQQVCLKKFKTMAMSGYYDNGNGEIGSRVLKKAGSIKTNGAVFDSIPGNAVVDFCAG